MSLLDSSQLFTLRLTELESELEAFCIDKAMTINSQHQFTLADVCLLEGLISHVWQAWCEFWRELIFKSCLGTTDANLNPIGPHPSASSEDHVSGAALACKRGKPKAALWGTTNTFRHLEPTWGDTNFLVSAISDLQVPRHNLLMPLVSGVHQSAKDLQTIRNACAHTNSQTMTEVRSLSSHYRAFAISHPSQAMFWLDNRTGQYLINFMIEELLEVASSAVV